MRWHAQTREIVYSVAIAIVLSVLALGLLGLFLGPLKIRAMSALLGVIVVILGALVTRNVRLFFLCGLAFSIPFTVGKVIGPVLNKGGGEVAFNLDATDFFLFGLCVFLARDIVTRRRPGILIPKAAYLWMAIIFMGTMTVIGGTYRTTAAHEVVRMVKMLLLFVVLCQELLSTRRMLHWVAALTSGLLVNAVVGLVQYYFHLTLGLADLGEPTEEVTKTLAATSLHNTEVWRVGAFLIHPNVFGAFLAALLPLCIASLLLPGGKLRKAYFFCAFVLGTGALLATQSRSGWIGFAASFVCFLFLSIAHSGLRRRSTLLAAAMFVVLAIIAIGAREQITRRIFESKEEALSFRGVFNEDARRMIADRPLWGFGLNSYVFQLPYYAKYEYGSWPPPVHQIYYLWWAETGAIGLGLHLAMWGTIVWIAIRNLRVRDERMFAVNACCIAAMLVFMLDGFVSFSLRITPTLKTFWVISAMIMAVHYWRLRHEVNGRAPVATRAYIPQERAAEPGLSFPTGAPA